MASDWNLLMDRLATVPLTKREGQVVAFVARKTLGWKGKRNGDRIAVKQIAAETGVDRRHARSALNALIADGIVRSRGGRRGVAAVLSINVDPAQPWRQRAPKEAHPNVRRKRRTLEPSNQPERAPIEAHERAPIEAHTRGKGVKKTSANLKISDAFDAYHGAGGKPLNEKERAALARRVSELSKAGEDPALILQAVREVVRRGEFTGNLRTVFKEIQENGGLCEWGDHDRRALTDTQLTGCGCNVCLEWLAYRQTEATAGAPAT